MGCDTCVVLQLDNQSLRLILGIPLLINDVLLVNRRPGCSGIGAIMYVLVKHPWWIWIDSLNPPSYDYHNKTMYNRIVYTYHMNYSNCNKNDSRSSYPRYANIGKPWRAITSCRYRKWRRKKAHMVRRITPTPKPLLTMPIVSPRHRGGTTSISVGTWARHDMDIISSIFIFPFSTYVLIAYTLYRYKLTNNYFKLANVFYCTNPLWINLILSNKFSKFAYQEHMLRWVMTSQTPP